MFRKVPKNNKCWQKIIPLATLLKAQDLFPFFCYGLAVCEYLGGRPSGPGLISEEHSLVISTRPVKSDNSLVDFIFCFIAKPASTGFFWHIFIYIYLKGGLYFYHKSFFPKYCSLEPFLVYKWSSTNAE